MNAEIYLSRNNLANLASISPQKLTSQRFIISKLISIISKNNYFEIKIKRQNYGLHF